jgi:medium-chain acyl-[acyl-carrier-protein] hydrolase
MKLQNTWFQCFKPNPSARLRLFCFPFAGGGASIFRTWPSDLPSDVELVAVQLPGREGRLLDTPLTGYEQIADALVCQFTYLDKPFIFLGHSMGAMLCYELARRLRVEREVSPVALLVSGRRAPHLAEDDHPIYTLPDLEFAEEIRSLNGTPEAVFQNEELFRLMLPLLRADFTVCDTYAFQPGVRLDCPITAIGGLEDPKTDIGTLSQWKEHTTGAFRLHMVSGDHFFLQKNRESFLQIVSRELHRFAEAIA